MPFEQMLQAQVEGRNSSWAVRWHASVVLHQRLSINANPPLVVNAGFDGTGRHASNDDRYHTPLALYPIYAELKEPIEEDKWLGIYWSVTTAAPIIN